MGPPEDMVRMDQSLYRTCADPLVITFLLSLPKCLALKSAPNKGFFCWIFGAHYFARAWAQWSIHWCANSTISGIMDMARGRGGQVWCSANHWNQVIFSLRLKTLLWSWTLANCLGVSFLQRAVVLTQCSHVCSFPGVRKGKYQKSDICV